jgi:hypothetical protein
VQVFFDTGSYTEQHVQYSALLTKPPNYFLQLQAENVSVTASDRVNVFQGELITMPSQSCYLIQHDYFSTSSTECVQNVVEENTSVEEIKFSSKWRLLWALCTVALVSFIVFTAVKKTWGKFIPIFLGFIFFTPFAYATDCSLTNLGACLPEMFFRMLAELVSKPIQPIIEGVTALLSAQVSIEPFFALWQIILYIMGFFYLIMLTYSGFCFLTSGHDVIKREQAKEWFKNTFLVMIFTSASFYFYGLVIELGAVLTASFLQSVNPLFFQFTIDNISDLGTQLIISLLTVIILGTTYVLLIIRYILTAIGVIFIPFALFCYFIPPLKSYGKLILHVLGVLIFIPVVNALLIIACSKLAETVGTAVLKTAMLFNCFLIINLVTVLLLWHVFVKSGTVAVGSKLQQVGKFIAGLF